MTLTISLVVAAAAVLWALRQTHLRQQAQKELSVHTVRSRPGLQADLAQARTDVQDEIAAITANARIRQEYADFIGELNAEKARTQSWKDRCMEIARERDSYRDELVKRGAVA